MKSKKGDIPVTVLVIGVLVVCGLAILSFYMNDIRVQNSLSSISIVEQAALTKEKIDFYTNERIDLSQEEIDELFDIKPETQGACNFRYFNITQGQVSVRYNLEVNCG